MKLKKEDLIDIARMRDKGISVSQIATKFNCNVTTIKRLIWRYKKHGIKGIMHKADSNNFSIESKIEIINRYYSGESKSSLATEINVNIGVIASWVKKYEQLGYNGLVDNRGRPGVSKVGRPKKNEQQSKIQAELTNDEREELNILRKKNKKVRNGDRSNKKIESLSSSKDRARNSEKVIVIDELRHKYSLNELLDYLEISKSSYYYSRSVSKKEDQDKYLKELIYETFENSKKRYGYRRITLIINKTMRVNHKKIKRIMKEMGLFAVQGKNGKYHSYKGDNGESKENLLLDNVIDENNKVTHERNFKTTGPNQKWTTDVSEFKHKDGKLYLSPILDMYDSSIISYDLSTSPNFEQTKRMLDKAFKDNPNVDGLIFHSDQGWQYQMKYYQKLLKSKNIKQSFSRKGNCMDNSLMENFFGITKNEMFYGHENEFETIDDLRKGIENYIKWYNEERINVKRKGLSPLEYRHQSLVQI